MIKEFYYLNSEMDQNMLLIRHVERKKTKHQWLKNINVGIIIIKYLIYKFEKKFEKLKNFKNLWIVSTFF